MSIRTTVTLDDDVVARVKRESLSRGASFRDTLNDLLRAALLGVNNKPPRALAIQPSHMGHKHGAPHPAPPRLATCRAECVRYVSVSEYL